MRSLALASAAAAAALFVGSTSQAAVSVSWRIVTGKDFEPTYMPAEVPFTGAGSTDLNTTTMATGWAGVILTATADTGQVIKGFDINLTTAAPQFNQRWTDLDGTFNYSPSASQANFNTGVSPSPTVVDSRILLAPGVSAISTLPNETNPGTGSPSSPSNDGTNLFGLGNSLGGAWGLPISSYKNAIDFAYLVVRIPLNGNVAVNVGGSIGQGPDNGTTDNTLTSNLGTVTIVPEPASISALALGALGLLARRRRA